MTAQHAPFQPPRDDVKPQLVAAFLTRRRPTPTHSPPRVTSMTILNLLFIQISVQAPSPPLPLFPRNRGHCHLQRPHLLLPIMHPIHSSPGQLWSQADRAPRLSVGCLLSHLARSRPSFRRVHTPSSHPYQVVLLLSHPHPNFPQKSHI